MKNDLPVLYLPTTDITPSFKSLSKLFKKSLASFVI